MASQFVNGPFNTVAPGAPGASNGGTASGRPRSMFVYHRGGKVRAPKKGGEVVAKLKDGERVLTPEQDQAYQSAIGKPEPDADDQPGYQGGGDNDADDQMMSQGRPMNRGRQFGGHVGKMVGRFVKARQRRK